MKADLRQDINRGLALAGALMEHFLERNALKGFGKLPQKRRLLFVTVLIWVNLCSNVLTEKFFQGNVPLWHLLNEETLFMS